MAAMREEMTSSMNEMTSSMNDAVSSVLDAVFAKLLLKPNKAIHNHDTGFKDPPELRKLNKMMVLGGLHPTHDEKARNQLDLSLYTDI
eukprot:5608427-Heterocapsa_arctica.AAC.1